MCDWPVSGKASAECSGVWGKLERIIIQVNATEWKGSSGPSEEKESVVLVWFHQLVLRSELGWQDVNNCRIVFN